MVIGQTINRAARLMTYCEPSSPDLPIEKERCRIYVDKRTEPKLRKSFIKKKIE